MGRYINCLLVLIIVCISVLAQTPTSTPDIHSQIQTEVKKLQEGVDKLIKREGKEDAGQPANKRVAPAKSHQTTKPAQEKEAAPVNRSIVDPEIAFRVQSAQQRETIAAQFQEISKLQHEIATQEQIVKDRDNKVFELTIENEAIKHNIKRRAFGRAFLRLVTFKW